MSYLKQWKDAKKTFEVASKNSKKAYEELKKEAKKLKKLNKTQEAAVANVETWVAKQDQLRKVKTGLTPVLKTYDKLLEAMEKGVQKRVPASKKSVWKPYVDALGKNKAKMSKSILIVRDNYTKLEVETKTFYKYEAGIREVTGKQTVKQYVGNNMHTDLLVNEITKIQTDLNKRLQDIFIYLRPGMEDW